MAKTAAERRAARKRKEQLRPPSTAAAGAAGHSPPDRLLRRLLHDGALAVAGFGPGDPDLLAARVGPRTPVDGAVPAAVALGP